MRRHSKQQARRLKEQGRITDKYQLHAWWLRGILDAVEGTARPPLHPDLYEEYDNGGWCVCAGYVRIADPQALRRLIADTWKGLPYRRAPFAQDHPDLSKLSKVPAIHRTAGTTTKVALRERNEPAPERH